MNCTKNSRETGSLPRLFSRPKGAKNSRYVYMSISIMDEMGTLDNDMKKVMKIEK